MANTIIKGKIFGETVNDLIEGSDSFLDIVKVSDYTAEEGTTVEFPVVGFLGDAIEVTNGKANYVDVNDKSVQATFKQYDMGVKLSDMELKESRIDRATGIRVQQTADSIKSKLKKLLIETLDTQQALEVEKLDENAVLDAQGLLGERLEQRASYIIANGKTINTLVKNVYTSNKTEKANTVFDSKTIRYNNVADGVFYLVQEDVMELLIGRGIESNVYRESDFHGEKINTDIIASAIVTEENRVVKVTVKTSEVEGASTKTTK